MYDSLAIQNTTPQAFTGLYRHCDSLNKPPDVPNTPLFGWIIEISCETYIGELYTTNISFGIRKVLAVDAQNSLSIFPWRCDNLLPGRLQLLRPPSGVASSRQVVIQLKFIGLSADAIYRHSSDPNIRLSVLWTLYPRVFGGASRVSDRTCRSDSHTSFYSGHRVLHAELRSPRHRICRLHLPVLDLERMDRATSSRPRLFRLEASISSWVCHPMHP